MQATHDETDMFIGLGEVSRSLGHTGREGKQVHPATLTRWIQTGVRLPDGSRLRLKANRVGSKWTVRPSWVTEFIEAQTAARIAPDARPLIRTPAERNRAADAAEVELLKMGA